MLRFILRLCVRGGQFQASSKLRHNLINEFVYFYKPSPVGIGVYIPLRWKSKGRVKESHAKIDLSSFSETLSSELKLDQATENFDDCLVRFQNRLEKFMVFNLSPQMFFELKVCFILKV